MSNDSSNHSNDRYPAVTWGPRRGVAAAVIALIIGQLLAGVVVVSILFALGMSSNETTSWSETAAGQFVLVGTAEVLTLALLWLILKKRRPTWAAIGFTQRPRLSDGGQAIVAGLVYFAMLMAAAGIAGWLFNVDVNQEQDVGFKAVATDADRLMAFISLVLLPPIVEEILFRGVLLGGLRKRLSFVWAALITSALFALPHALQGSGGTLLWIGAIDTFLLSLVLCYLREKTGGLWASIILHMIKNGIAYTFLFVIGT